MDGRIYLPTVAWCFKVRNVILLTRETIESAATYRVTAIPFDSSDPGANEGTKEVGFYVTDNVGNIYTVIATGTHTVDLSDDFRSGVGPQTGKWAVLSKSVGNGEAPFLTPIHYRRLDRSAIDNVRRIELDILWRNRGTDEKVKYDAADPTAGYLSEKIVAGSNILISEGAGDDENKLKIAADLSGVVPNSRTITINGTTQDLSSNRSWNIEYPDHRPKQITGLTLLSTGWTLVAGLYKYDLANANITANSIVEVIPDNSSISIVKAAEILPETDSSAGSVKLYATNAPTGGISVTINITEKQV